MSQVSTGDFNILLVEDNPGDARIIREAFTAVDIEPAFHTVSDGTDALDFLFNDDSSDSAHWTDLILLDLNLPQKDGFAVLDELQGDTDFGLLPVVVLTSSSAEEDIISSYELDANAYLTKPRSPVEYESLAKAIEEFWIDTAALPPVSG